MVHRLFPLLVLAPLAWSGCAQPSAQVTSFVLPSATSGPAHLVAAPNGFLWVVETFAGKLARISMTGAIKEFDLPAQVSVGQLAVGPDGTLWLTEQGENRLGHLDPGGRMSEVVLPPVNTTARALAPDYRGLVVADQAVWVIDSTNQVIRRVATNGTMTTFSVTDPVVPPIGSWRLVMGCGLVP